MNSWHNTTYWWYMLSSTHSAKIFWVVISWNVKKGDWFFPPWKSISLFGKHNRLFHSCPITILSFKLDICDRWWWELAVLVHIIYHERKPTNICIHISGYKRKYTVFQKQVYCNQWCCHNLEFGVNDITLYKVILYDFIGMQFNMHYFSYF